MRALAQDIACEIHPLNNTRVPAKAGSAMHAACTRMTFGTWPSSHLKRCALKICGTSTQSARPGDLIFTGTPAGVAAVGRGQTLTGRIAGLGELVVTLR